MVEYIIAIAGLLLPVCALLAWLAIRSAKSEGAAQERQQAATGALDEVKKANDAVASVGSMPADERRRRLQQWSRD